MTLPPLAELTALDILWFYQNTEAVEELLKSHRLAENLPTNEYGVDDLVWHSFILEEGMRLTLALTEVSPKDIIDFWRKKTGRRKPQGGAFEVFHVMAFRYIHASRKTRTQAYHDIAQPYLIKNGRLALTAEGDPDPEQDMQERHNFEKVMDRLSAKLSKVRPKT